MGKESRVEIPVGSGNFYRYEYEDGSTKYLGSVGSSPELNEEDFLKAMTEKQKPLTEGEWLDLAVEIHTAEQSIIKQEEEINRKEREVEVLKHDINMLRDQKMKDETDLFQVHYAKVMNTYQDKDHWKNRIPRFKVPSNKLGGLARRAITVFHGGAEYDPETKEVWSKGYYFYTES